MRRGRLGGGHATKRVAETDTNGVGGDSVRAGQNARKKAAPTCGPARSARGRRDHAARRRPGPGRALLGLARGVGRERDLAGAGKGEEGKFIFFLFYFFQSNFKSISNPTSNQAI